MRKAAAAEMQRARDAHGEEPSPLPSPLSNAEEGRAGYRGRGQQQQEEEEETNEAPQRSARSSSHHTSGHKPIRGIRYSRSTLAHSPPSHRGGGLVLHATARVTAAAIVDPRIRLPTLVHTTIRSHRPSSGRSSSTRPRPRAAVEGEVDGSAWLRRAMHVMIAMP